MASVLSGIKRLARPPVFIFFSLTVLFSLSTAISGEATGLSGSLEREGLDLPLICQLGETCWVANYVDVASGDAARDFRCQGRTYNAHNGTDFAIRDRGVMDQGVPVVASAP